MSLILDALKKAEKERVTPNASTNQYDPFVKDTNKKNNVPLLVVLIVIALLAFAYLKFFKKPTSAALQPKSINVSAPALPTPPPPPPPTEDADAIRKKALSAFQEENFEGSKVLWEKLTLLTPTDPEVYNNLGVVLKKLENKEAAKEAYRKALDLKPDYAEALNNYGVVLMENQLIDQAKDFFSKAISLKPDYAEPYFHMALLSENIGNHKLAVSQYQKFLDASPSLSPKLKTQIEIRMATLKGL